MLQHHNTGHILCITGVSVIHLQWDLVLSGYYLEKYFIINVFTAPLFFEFVKTSLFSRFLVSGHWCNFFFFFVNGISGVGRFYFFRIFAGSGGKFFTFFLATYFFLDKIFASGITFFSTNRRGAALCLHCDQAGEGYIPFRLIEACHNHSVTIRNCRERYNKIGLRSNCCHLQPEVYFPAGIYKEVKRHPGK